MVGICRLCAALKTNDLLVSLFDAVESIPTKVERCCQVDVLDGQELPQNVCRDCLDMLNKSFAFAEKVAMAQNTLHTAFPSPNIASPPTAQPVVENIPQVDCVANWDERKVNGIDQESILALQAMKMYVERMSIENISLNLGAPKLKIEKWISSLNIQQPENSENDLIYEIFDDSSMSDGENVEEIPKPARSTSSLATLRWSENSESDTRSEASWAKNSGDTEPTHTTDCQQRVTDVIETDSGIEMKITRQQQTNRKHTDLKRWKDVPCRCGTCKEKFAGLDDLRIHVIKKHLSQGSGPRRKHYGCGLCFKAFENNGKLMGHKVTAHVSQLRLTCFICEDIFTNKLLLDRHMETHKENCYPCAYCGKTYTTSFNRKRHQRSDHSELYNLECLNCKEAFLNAQSLATHVAKHKKDEATYMCGLCGKTMGKQSTLVDHVASHDQNPHIIFKCGSCEEEFKSMQLYQLHIKTHSDIGRSKKSKKRLK